MTGLAFAGQTVRVSSTSPCLQGPEDDTPGSNSGWSQVFIRTARP